MRLLPILVAAVVAGLAPAQTVGVVEITKSQLRRPHSLIDMDKAGNAGTTTEALVNSAGAVCGGGLREIKLVPSSAAQGVYNTNPGNGRALGRATSGNGLILVDPPSGAFGAFNAEIGLAINSTEFGISIGDWRGPMVLTFHKAGKLVTSFTSSTYAAATMKYFQMTGGNFDEVRVRASTTSGNWVIPEISTEIPGNGYTPFGRGCVGSSNREPKLAAGQGSAAKLGGRLTVELTGVGQAGIGTFIVGGSARQFPGIGRLPVDLKVVGAAGCLLWTDVVLTVPVPYVNGVGRFGIGIPNNPFLLGKRIVTQFFLIDPTTRKISVSNGAMLCPLR